MVVLSLVFPATASSVGGQENPQLAANALPWFLFAVSVNI